LITAITKPQLDKLKLKELLAITAMPSQQAEYLFFERLGISDNEELAFEEAINYINNKLTIN
jgi:hypothetical protein